MYGFCSPEGKFSLKAFSQAYKNKDKYSDVCFLVRQTHIYSICHMNKTNRICSIHLHNLFWEKSQMNKKRVFLDLDDTFQNFPVQTKKILVTNYEGH